MTNLLNLDSTTQKTEFLPFAPGDLDCSGLRITRAEFSRFLGVSKQAVGEWVTAGKITLGADGRLDPRQAVSQLLRNTDPARLRAKVLEPLARDIGKLQKQVADLKKALAQSREDATFHEESSGELVEQFITLDRHLVDERAVLVSLPADKVIDGLTVWLKRISEEGISTAGMLTILDCVPGNGLDIGQQELDSMDKLPLGALQENTGRGWDDDMIPTPDELASMEADLKKMNTTGDDYECPAT